MSSGQSVIGIKISNIDYERPILAAEEKFFNECNTGNGELVPSCH